MPPHTKVHPGSHIVESATLFCKEMWKIQNKKVQKNTKKHRSLQMPYTHYLFLLLVIMNRAHSALPDCGGEKNLKTYDF